MKDGNQAGHRHDRPSIPATAKLLDALCYEQQLQEKMKETLQVLLQLIKKDNNQTLLNATTLF